MRMRKRFPLMMKFFIVFSVVALALPMFFTTESAEAYSWKRTLKRGDSGADVRELQIRVAGWAADSPSQTYVAVDGVFGAGTEAAVKRFQRAYGLTADGIVGPQTQAKLNALEASDGSTVNFNWSEFHSKDGSGFSGGKVGSATVKENVRRMMYKLEAVRKKAGNSPVIINSGFRSVSHNSRVGGASNSMHMYGVAADIKINGKTPTQVRSIVRTSGFSGSYAESTYNHIDSRIEYNYGSKFWYWN